MVTAGIKIRSSLFQNGMKIWFHQIIITFIPFFFIFDLNLTASRIITRQEISARKDPPKAAGII